MKISAAIVLSMAAMLTGCSGMRLVDSDVSAVAAPGTPAIAAPLSYRFEREASASGQPPHSAELEALVAAELAKVGFRQEASAPQYSVQFDLQMLRYPFPPWDDPRPVPIWKTPFPVATPYGNVMHFTGPLVVRSIAYFKRELELRVTRRADDKVVFETSAKHDGPWPDNVAILPPMFEAALRGFPEATPGIRRVVIEIPR